VLLVVGGRCCKRNDHRCVLGRRRSPPEGRRGGGGVCWGGGMLMRFCPAGWAPACWLLTDSRAIILQRTGGRQPNFRAVARPDCCRFSFLSCAQHGTLSEGGISQCRPSRACGGRIPKPVKGVFVVFQLRVFRSILQFPWRCAATEGDHHLSPPARESTCLSVDDSQRRAAGVVPGSFSCVETGFIVSLGRRTPSCR